MDKKSTKNQDIKCHLLLNRDIFFFFFSIRLSYRMNQPHSARSHTNADDVYRRDYSPVTWHNNKKKSVRLVPSLLGFLLCFVCAAKWLLKTLFLSARVCNSLHSVMFMCAACVLWIMTYYYDWERLFRAKNRQPFTNYLLPSNAFNTKKIKHLIR